jgi:hypothetical protein
MSTPSKRRSESDQGHLGLMAAYLLLIGLTAPFSQLVSVNRWGRWYYAVRTSCRVDAFMKRAINRHKKH